jgi:quercetin dioxygenase-like cupin family protein
MLIQSLFKCAAIAALWLIATAASAQSLPEMRMTPAEIQALPLDDNQIGSSKLAGVHTKVVFGDPSKAGFYTILLFVPVHTTIQAHSHRDDRVATVVSGGWHLGYGKHFDAKSLKTLPPGSVYSEPAGDNHFAQTDVGPVIVEISGYGPTDTHYFEAKNDPKAKESQQ